MKFTLSKRPAKLGTNLPFRTEFHGDDSVTAGDVAINSVMLDDSELCVLLQEPLAFKALYKSRPNSTLFDPLFPGLKPLKLTDTIDEASLVVYVGVEQGVIELGTTRLKNITLEPTAGGMTAMSFTAQCTPTLDKRIGELLDHLAAAIHIEVAYKHNAKQSALQLEGGKGDKPKGKRKLKVPDETGHVSPPPIVSRGGDAIDAETIARTNAKLAAQNAAHVVDPDSPEYVQGPLDEATA
jgi:hypothetical protein